MPASIKVARVLGAFTLLCTLGAVLAGLAPTRSVPNGYLLILAAAAAVFVGCWVAVSWAALRRRTMGGVDLVKHPAQQRRWKLLRTLVALVFALSSGSALSQGIGPDGEMAAWVDKVQRAGGDTYAVPIDRVVGTPEPTGVNINDVDQYATTVTVFLKTPEGRRKFTVDGVRTRGTPQRGEQVLVMYAPAHPELGVRDDPTGFFDGSFFLIFIWAWTLVAILAGMGFIEEEDVALLRRFSPRIHLPVIALFLLGGALLLPLKLGFPPTLVGWLLALLASVMPWLALVWVRRSA
ncbi:hypothetical protein AB0L33_20550 [Streptomyces sp. NPDC052299]|uniref:hypothetical protein n=1 Tax=Streptomyces sp. NPDC052299 TaxID=3155054 RepID=UPI0034277391